MNQEGRLHFSEANGFFLADAIPGIIHLFG